MAALSAAGCEMHVCGRALKGIQRDPFEGIMGRYSGYVVVFLVLVGLKYGSAAGLKKRVPLKGIYSVPLKRIDKDPSKGITQDSFQGGWGGIRQV